MTVAAPTLLRLRKCSSFGSKEGLDKLNDLSDAADLKRLEWRRGSAARLKAQFQRDKLPLEGRISYDMWLDELDSAALAYKFRDYEYAAGQIQSSLANFLIGSHLVEAPSDMAAYNARVMATGHAMDQVRERTKRRVPLTTPELIADLNPVIRGWGNYYKRAHVRKLFGRLNGWIVHRIWSHRCKRWRNRGWRQLPETTLYGEYGLVNLIQLIPSIASRKFESS